MFYYGRNLGLPKLLRKFRLPKLPKWFIFTNISVHKFTFKKRRKGVEILNNVLHSSRNNFSDDEVLRR
jgi:hypothetical protein